MSGAGIQFLTMPKWGLAMTKGTVVGWLIEEGAEVRPGLELVEIETEKIVSPIEAATSGILFRRKTVSGGMASMSADAAGCDC